MKVSVLFFISYLISITAFSQKSFNIVCRDFTFQQEISTRGKNIRNVFEVVISKINLPLQSIGKR
jgi:hypothetical protein